MRKRYILLAIAAISLAFASVGITLAILVGSSNPVVNTFTIGGVSISLEETTGDDYKMAPGVTVTKDPVVTVRANSEKCWLFVKMEKENDFDEFCTYEICDGWTAFDGADGVYYRIVEKSSSDAPFSVIKDNAVVIKDTVTEEQLNAVVENPKLTLTAYAAQCEGLATVSDAWKALNKGGEE